MLWVTGARGDARLQNNGGDLTGLQPARSSAPHDAAGPVEAPPWPGSGAACGQRGPHGALPPARPPAGAPEDVREAGADPHQGTCSLLHPHLHLNKIM